MLQSRLQMFQHEIGDACAGPRDGSVLAQLLYCAVYDIVFFGRDHYYLYLLLQSAAAFIVGFGYVGATTPS